MKVVFRWRIADSLRVLDCFGSYIQVFLHSSFSPAPIIGDHAFRVLIIDDYDKGGLTQFWELFTMIPCAPKYLKR